MNNTKACCRFVLTNSKSILSNLLSLRLYPEKVLEELYQQHQVTTEKQRKAITFYLKQYFQLNCDGLGTKCWGALSKASKITGPYVFCSPPPLLLPFSLFFSYLGSCFYKSWISSCILLERLALVESLFEKFSAYACHCVGLIYSE